MLPKAWQNLMSNSGTVPFVVKAIDRVLDEDWFMEPNIHDHFELVYMKRGEAVFLIDGSQVKLGPNNVVLIKPNRTHKLLVKSKGGCEFIVLSFRLIDMENTGISKTSMEDFIDFVEGEKAGPCLTLKVGQRNEIVQLLNRIVDEKNNKSPDSEFLIHLLVMELFVHLSRALRIEWENSMKDKTPKLQELIKISVNYINQNYEKDLSLGAIANYIYLSPSYFAKVFRDQMKQSPINYLLRLRIEKAKEMLEKTDLMVGDIALGVGFSNHQRFNEIFRKFVNMTPSAYKNSINDTIK